MSAWTDSVRATPAEIPGPVNNLRCAEGDESVELTFDELVGATDYDYRYRAGTSGAWIEINGTQISAVGGTVTVVRTGLDNGTEYLFQARATNASGDGPWGPEPPIACTPAAPLMIPPIPPNFRCDEGDGQLTVRWDAAGSGNNAATSYVIREPLFGFELVTINATESLVWVRTGLDNGTEYRMTITARNAAGESGSSPTLGCTPREPPTVPSAVDDLIVRDAGDQYVELEWTAPDDGERYDVRQRIGSAVWVTIATDVDDTEYRAVGLDNGTEYDFGVLAKNDVGPAAAWSNTVSSTPQADVPNAPRNCSSSARIESLRVRWDEPAAGGGEVVGYRYRHRVQGGEWGAYTTTTGTAVTIGGLIVGTRYEIEVVAYNDAGTSAPCSTSRTALGELEPPSGFRCAPANESVTLNWDLHDAVERVSVYEVEWRGGGEGLWDQQFVSASTSQLVVSELENATSYEFRVRARHTADISDWSTISCIPANPEALDTPANFRCGALNASVRIDWNAVASADGYDYEWRRGANGTVSSSSTTGTGATIGSLDNNVEYQVRVRATGTLDSPWTAWESCTPTCATPGVPAHSCAPGNSRVTVSWGSVSGANDYRVRYRSGSVWTTRGWTTELSETITGLSNGTPYLFQVQARNACGEGSWSGSETCTPICRTPAAPHSPFCTAGDGSVTVRWSSIFDANDYRVRWAEFIFGSAPLPWTTRAWTTEISDTITGLSGAYTFEVQARNACGESLWGAPRICSSG